MTETKHEKFERMLATRLPKAVKAVELLANLSRKSDYEYWQADVQAMLDQLDDAVDLVAQSFGVKGEEPEVLREIRETAPPPGGDVELDQRAEVRWAHDALRRGDKELAEDRLSRVIAAWIAEEK